MNRNTPIRMTRRAALAAGCAALALPAAAEEPIPLSWDDLLPEDERSPVFALMREMGVLQHGAFEGQWEQNTDVRLNDQFSGRRVKLAGFAIPLDYDGLAARTLILAPFVGACIHVPPPPPNQLVLVTTERPYEIADVFEPVEVTGLFGTMAAETELAEIGYTLTAERISRYEF
jgi:hypothetical protein